jgi:hypothetical protein
VLMVRAALPPAVDFAGLYRSVGAHAGMSQCRAPGVDIGALDELQAERLATRLIGPSAPVVPSLTLDDVPLPVWPQPVIATALANAFDGVIHPRVCRGRVLRERAMASSWRWLWIDRSVFFGKY